MEANRNVLEVNWYNKRYWDTMTKKYTFIHSLPKRNVLNVNLNGDISKDDFRLKFGELYIKETISKKDTVHAINFRLGNGCKYSALVRILDICNINCIDCFAPSDDGILMYYEYPPESTDTTKYTIMPL